MFDTRVNGYVTTPAAYLNHKQKICKSPSKKNNAAKKNTWQQGSVTF